MTSLVENIYKMLYKEESKGLVRPEKISTRWPMRCHVAGHVHIAEAKEIAQVPPPTNRILSGLECGEIASLLEAAATLCTQAPRARYYGPGDPGGSPDLS
jgi:hypothetical protein